MRKIKYQAWVKNLTDDNWRMMQVRWINFETMSICTESGLQTTEFVLREFTTTYDVENKEIYEGDILEFEGYLGVVEWSEDTFGWCVNFGSDTEWLGDCWDAKIVGNIYENPELLEVV